VREEGNVKKAVRYKVHGKVQGVGYRVFARTCAEALGISGWVRNREDGSVEVHAEGSEEQHAELEFDLSRGARYARPSTIEKTEVEPEGLSGFEIRR
jgi:acylphosphatase